MLLHIIILISWSNYYQRCVYLWRLYGALLRAITSKCGSSQFDRERGKIARSVRKINIRDFLINGTLRLLIEIGVQQAYAVHRNYETASLSYYCDMSLHCMQMQPSSVTIFTACLLMLRECEGVFFVRVEKLFLALLLLNMCETQQFVQGQHSPGPRLHCLGKNRGQGTMLCHHECRACTSAWEKTPLNGLHFHFSHRICTTVRIQKAPPTKWDPFDWEDRPCTMNMWVLGLWVYLNISNKGYPVRAYYAAWETVTWQMLRPPWCILALEGQNY